MTKKLISFLAITIMATYNTSFATTATKMGAEDWINERVQYAYDISGGNKRFIGTIDSENSQWTYDRRSNTGYWRNGRKYYDFGLCQISEYYHRDITDNALFWVDWKWQMDRCWELYSSGTKFYGSKNAYRSLKGFRFE